VAVDLALVDPRQRRVRRERSRVRIDEHGAAVGADAVAGVEADVVGAGAPWRVAGSARGAAAAPADAERRLEDALTAGAAIGVGEAGLGRRADRVAGAGGGTAAARERLRHVAAGDVGLGARVI